MKTDLPPRPDLPAGTWEPVAAAAPRRKVWPWVLGVVLVLAVAGSISQSGSETTTAPVADPIQVETGMTRDEAMTASVPLTDQAADELRAVTTSSSIAEMSGHLDRASDLTDQAAALFDGVDDAMAGYLHSAADHYAAAADDLEAGRITAGTAEIEAATADINAATALV